MDGTKLLKRLVALECCALVLGVAACGVTPIGNGHATGASSTMRSTATAGAGNSGPQGAAVTVTPSQAQFAASARITLVIQNAGVSMIYVAERYTNCTAVQLERLAGAAWRTVNPCLNSYPHPRVAQLAAGASMAVQLSATIPASDAAGGGSSQWSSGTYRALLRYVTSQNTALSQGTAVYSTTFVVP
ncbi:MAG: hypothetical protein ACHQ4H_15535 [Ktedonobacterales bacterium]